MLSSSNVGGGIRGWWEDVLWPSSSPSSCGIPLLLGEDEASGGDEASGTDATPGEKAAFLFLVALVSRATGCCCWSFLNQLQPPQHMDFLLLLLWEFAVAAAAGCCFLLELGAVAGCCCLLKLAAVAGCCWLLKLADVAGCSCLLELAAAGIHTIVQYIHNYTLPSVAEPEPVEPKLIGDLEPEPKINLNKHFLKSVWRML